MGRKSKKKRECICITGSLCWTTETNTNIIKQLYSKQTNNSVVEVQEASCPSQWVNNQGMGRLWRADHPAPSLGRLGLIQVSSGNDWSRKWQPTPVFLPGRSHGQSSLVGYSPWSRKESDTTEHTHIRVLPESTLSVKHLKSLKIYQ